MEENTPNKDDDMMQMQDDEEKELLDSSKSSVADPAGKWDDDKFIWDKKDLIGVNKRRLMQDVIPYVLRYEEANLGIRAHPNLSWTMCLKSLFMPWHNEFINIWIYLIFAVYFWVQTIMIASHDTKDYEFNRTEDFYFMFIGTLGIALSFSCTAVYLTFYSLGEKEQMMFESFNYMGLLVLAYLLTFCFIASELFDKPMYFYLLLMTIIILGTNLVLVQYKIGRTISFWTTSIWLGFIYIYSLCFANKH